MKLNLTGILRWKLSFGLVAMSLAGCLVSATEPTEPILTVESKYALKDLDGHFPFAVPETKEAWEARAKELRQQMLVSLGMYPMPTLAPMKPVVHSVVKWTVMRSKRFTLKAFQGSLSQVAFTRQRVLLPKVKSDLRSCAPTGTGQTVGSITPRMLK